MQVYVRLCSHSGSSKVGRLVHFFGGMIYDIESGRFRAFLASWLRQQVRECKKEGARVEEAVVEIRRKQFYINLSIVLFRPGPLSVWKALKRLGELKRLGLVNRCVRWDKRGGAVRPVTTGPGGNCDAVLEHGGRLSRVYFDHLRVDASNVLVAEPRIYEYVAGYLDLPHKQTTDAHAFSPPCITKQLYFIGIW